MENIKLTLEDLKLESFLTEIDNSKLVKMQGGNGAYSDTTDPTGSNGTDCETTVYTTDPEYSTNDEETNSGPCDEDYTYGGGDSCDGDCETSLTTDYTGDQTEGSCDNQCGG